MTPSADAETLKRWNKTSPTFRWDNNIKVPYVEHDKNSYGDGYIALDRDKDIHITSVRD